MPQFINLHPDQLHLTSFTQSGHVSHPAHNHLITSSSHGPSHRRTPSRQSVSTDTRLESPAPRHPPLRLADFCRRCRWRRHAADDRNYPSALGAADTRSARPSSARRGETNMVRHGMAGAAELYRLRVSGVVGTSSVSTRTQRPLTRCFVCRRRKALAGR